MFSNYPPYPKKDDLVLYIESVSAWCDVCMYVFFWESLIWWPKGMLTSLYARPLWPLENVWGHNLQQRDCGQHSSLNSSLHSSLSLYWYYMYYVPPLVVVAWSTVEMAQWVILSRIESNWVKMYLLSEILCTFYFIQLIWFFGYKIAHSEMPK